MNDSFCVCLKKNNCYGGHPATWLTLWSRPAAAAPPEHQAVMDQVHFRSARLPCRLRACFALSPLSAA